MSWFNKLFGLSDESPASRPEPPVSRSEPPVFRPDPLEYPKTFANDRSREEVFDPALKHYVYGFRAADPEIADPNLREKWHHTRRAALERILEIIHDSKWREHLVLRGGLSMHCWFGALAREPRDLDWVFVPEDVQITDRHGGEFFLYLQRTVSTLPQKEEFTFIPQQMATDEIWTYERAAGKRIIIPWIAEGLPGGEVQLDIVFDEPLPCVPETITIQVGDRELSFLAAEKALSLAWKILWLASDSYPEGKDLFDAVILAENTELTPKLLQKVLSDGEFPQGLDRNFPNALISELEWKTFKTSYPEIPGTAEEWLARFIKALEKTLDAVKRL